MANQNNRTCVFGTMDIHLVDRGSQGFRDTPVVLEIVRTMAKYLCQGNKGYDALKLVWVPQDQVAVNDANREVLSVNARVNQGLSDLATLVPAVNDMSSLFKAPPIKLWFNDDRALCVVDVQGPTTFQSLMLHYELARRQGTQADGSPVFPSGSARSCATPML
ncbi:MAG TPA: hypothetical protein DCY07_01415 [Rhodospirillaceae bacterium]|nr:hypothetical protein [Rhodospirillaceae bacterium]